MTSHQYLRAVLHRYTELPDTPQRPRKHDRQLAQMLYLEGVPLETINAALLLATARRNLRQPNDNPLIPIRSLHYFLPVIRELQANPPDPLYFDLIAYQLQRHCLNSKNERPES